MILPAGLPNCNGVVKIGKYQGAIVKTGFKIDHFNPELNPFVGDDPASLMSPAVLFHKDILVEKQPLEFY